MSWTKRQLVEMAYAKAGFGSVAGNVNANQLQNALFDLDSMMAVWKENNINLGYPIPETQEESSLDDNSMIPAYANSAVYLNLALLLAGNSGKIVAPTTIDQANRAYASLTSMAARPIPKQFSNTMPSGAGNKPWRGTRDAFLRTPLTLDQLDPLNTPTPTLARQYESPAATGFSVSVKDSPASIHLVLTPDDAYAAGTIVLPAVSNAGDGQQVLVISTKAVTALTVDGNGAADVVDEPSTLAANTPFRLRFNGDDRTWKLMA